MSRPRPTVPKPGIVYAMRSKHTNRYYRSRKVVAQRRPNKCQNSHRYKGLRAPTCNGGAPCVACIRKWATSPHNKDCLNPDPERKLRRCLGCGEDFVSSWIGNRMCVNCKSYGPKGQSMGCDRRHNGAEFWCE